MDRREGPADATDGAIIVTGGSRGIGAAVARHLGALGVPVAVNYVNDEAAAASVVAAIQDAGGTAVAVRADVAIEADVVAMFDAAERELGPLGGLVNNAGITGEPSAIADLPAETMDRVYAVNVRGSMLCAREFVRRCSTRRGGRGGSIVNLSSLAARLGRPGEWVYYSATKGAINSFTVGLGREVGLDGIRVNAVAPGLVRTEIHDAAGGAERLEQLAAAVPLGRVGTVEEIAETVAWLLSPAASYVTGSIIEVGGGR